MFDYKKPNGATRSSQCALQRGGALVEYTIIVSLLVVVLLANPNVIRDLAHAIRDAYTSFVYALSVSWI
jgi:Flp pilus assembly pilin Flp